MVRHFNNSGNKSKRRNLRATMPKAEVLLWSVLKERQLLGVKFRRQYGVGPYILDFYSSELKLGIELDGESHYVEGAKQRDSRRDNFIASFGICVLRFLNPDIYDKLDGVWDAITRAARAQMVALGIEQPPGRRSGGRRRSRESDGGGV
jgi:very-short-patch-repair endonuclease